MDTIQTFSQVPTEIYDRPCIAKAAYKLLGFSEFFGLKFVKTCDWLAHGFKTEERKFQAQLLHPEKTKCDFRRDLEQEKRYLKQLIDAGIVKERITFKDHLTLDAKIALNTSFLAVTSPVSIPAAATAIGLRTYLQGRMHPLTALTPTSHKVWDGEPFTLLDANMAGTEFRIMDYLNGVPPTKERVKKWIRLLLQEDPDVICLQEAFDIDDIYQYIAKGLQEEGFYVVMTTKRVGVIGMTAGLLLASRYPIEDVGFVKYPHPMGDDKYAAKGVLTARIALNEDVLITVTLVDEPYRGLEVYRTEDSHLFFGRRQETAELVHRLQHNRWLQVEGASGSGKSSLVRAGLLPALTRRLRDGNDTDWTFLTMRPGSQPVKELALALLNLNADDNTPGLLTTLETALWHSPQALTDLIREWNQRQHPDAPQSVLLVVDQLEELFIQTPETMQVPGTATSASGNQGSSTIRRPRDQFITLLLAALEDTDGPLRLVSTIRSDFLHMVTGHPRLAEGLNRAERYALPPQSRDQLKRVIVEPLRMAGGRVESDELVDRLIQDTEEGPGRLPLLSHALRSLWLAARKRSEQTPTLKFSDYEAIGGVGGAVTQSADALLHSLTESQQQAARRMLLQLIQVGRGTQDVRKSAAKSTLLSAGGDDAETVLVRLSGGRIKGEIRCDAPPRLLAIGEVATAGGSQENDTAQVVDLIHDSLVTEWETFRGWLNAARRDLERRDDLEAAAKVWQQAGEKENDLPGQGLLTYYQSWDGEPLPLSLTAQHYLSRGARRINHQRWRASDRGSLAQRSQLVVCSPGDLRMAIAADGNRASVGSESPEGRSPGSRNGGRLPASKEVAQLCRTAACHICEWNRTEDAGVSDSCIAKHEQRLPGQNPRRAGRSQHVLRQMQQSAPEFTRRIGDDRSAMVMLNDMGDTLMPIAQMPDLPKEQRWRCR